MISDTSTMIGKLGGDMFKNMKIPVENNLDEIVAELGRLGFKPLNKFAIKPNFHLWLVCDCDGFILGCRNALILGDNYYKTTTLTELKEM